MSRSIDRSILRKKYDDFCIAWKNEKMFQRIAQEDGQELPKGAHLLGKKPTFKMWMMAAKNGTFNAPEVASKSVEVTSPAWEE